jgi:hypothetical protein
LVEDVVVSLIPHLVTHTAFLKKVIDDTETEGGRRKGGKVEE